MGRALRLGQARGPSAAATGKVKLRHLLDPCTKLIGGGQGGGPKIVLYEHTQIVFGIRLTSTFSSIVCS